MSYDLDDTIAAIATAAGGADRGIVRISGPVTRDIVVRSFTAADGRTLDSIRHPTVVAGKIAVPIDRDRPQQLPCDLFLWPDDRSYTRQPVAELHTIGSPPLLRAVLDRVCRGGARLADPGEFTLRAFLAGRLDLTQAEAVLGVIDAERSEQLQTALGQLAGGLAKPLHLLRDELLQLLAELEAGLDFVEDDIEFISAALLARRLEAVATELHGVMSHFDSRSANATAHQVVLMGPPNAGKSSLFNAMSRRFAVANAGEQREAPSAIVSEVRGTTRDYLTATIDLGDVSCELVDTAGVESSIEPRGDIDNPDIAAKQIQGDAQSLTCKVRDRATLRALCVDVSEIDNVAAFTDIGLSASRAKDCELLVITKADRATVPVPRFDDTAPIPVIVTSSVTGQGLDALRAAICERLHATARSERGGAVAATAARCRDNVRIAERSLAHALEVARAGGGDELVAAELRATLAELGKVVGMVYTDDILDRIFSTFCIGK